MGTWRDGLIVSLPFFWWSVLRNVGPLHPIYMKNPAEQDAKQKDLTRMLQIVAIAADIYVACSNPATCHRTA